ncbi:Inner membrane protein YbaN [Ensifer adhaerens]|uniref:YbaN family protein n=1 Tax=Ensifer adhaerens TaxID=106592 RepID=UPI0015695961|nr:YbaN family protein [Ensifer adhaerens]NRP22367.1 Inner membrane protein YbaN [Ensifer adhaerens]
MNLPLRLLCIGLGWLMVGFAIAGIFLPILPTTPFLLLAAGLFARASPRLERWLLEHPTFGPSLRLWREKGAIPARAKTIALALMLVSFVFFCLASKPSLLLAAIVGGAMLLPALFIITRPNA